MPFEKSAGAIIFYREKDGTIKYLLLQHNRDYWNFPKGLIEKGEDEIVTVIREVKEETGLVKIKIIPNFKIGEKYFYRAPKDYRKIDQRGKTIFKTVSFYLAESETKSVKISFEHQGYEWLNFEEALEKLKKYKSTREILKKANDYLMKHIT